MVLLKEKDGGRYLPGLIGPVEAAAITRGQLEISFPRPLTHDLFRDALAAAGVRLVQAEYVGLAEGIFYADLVLSNGTRVSARPADAIALAVRTGAHIFATAAILDEAGLATPPEGTEPYSLPDLDTAADDTSLATPSSKAGPLRTAAMIEMELVGVRVEVPSNRPIVMLKEKDGPRYLRSWIGPAEASAIALAQAGAVALRPLTHDLFRDVLRAAGVRLVQAEYVALAEGTFYADLVLSNGTRVSARPSDAIALALRTGAHIFATAAILDEAGVSGPTG